MSFVLLALLAAFTAATSLVLADSLLRLRSALGGLKAQRMAVSKGPAAQPHLRLPAARVTTRLSYARKGAAAGFTQGAPRRAAA